MITQEINGNKYQLMMLDEGSPPATPGMCVELTGRVTHRVQIHACLAQGSGASEIPIVRLITPNTRKDDIYGVIASKEWVLPGRFFWGLINGRLCLDMDGLKREEAKATLAALERTFENSPSNGPELL